MEDDVRGQNIVVLAKIVGTVNIVPKTVAAVACVNKKTGMPKTGESR